MLIRRCFPLLLVGSIKLAMAADACEPDPAYLLPDTREAQEVLDRELAVLSLACEHSARFLAWRGALSNALGRVGEAALLLERAILLDPDFVGARIDFADALARSGDRESARVILREVLDRPDLPVGLAPLIAARLEALPEIEDAPWRIKGQLETRVGHESNLNSAPVDRDYELTLSEGANVFRLGEGQAARSGVATVLGVEVEGERFDDDMLLSLRGSHQRRETNGVADFAQSELLGRLRFPEPGGEWNGSLGYAHLGYQGRSVLGEWRAQGGYLWRGAELAGGVGVETAVRRSPASPNYDGEYRGGALEASWHNGASAWVVLRGGRDFPERARPGGDQDRREYRFGYRYPVGKGAATAAFDRFEEHDREGYSSVLSNNRRRVVIRQQLTLRYQQPLNDHWVIQLDLQKVRQAATLPLFEFANFSGYIGLQWRFGAH